jgi:phosphatidylserine decarboxylase
MIAREGGRLILYQVVASLIFLYAGLRSHSVLLLTLFWLTLLFLTFTLYFFRDPERQTPTVADAIIAPADGKVIKIERITDQFVGEGYLISTFMSPFNVHVNRNPFDGKVAQINYRKGKFWSAFKDEALLENEQNQIQLESARGRMTYTQVAGAFARRIVCHLKTGDVVQRGARFGMIMFGSRVDLVVPVNTKISVSLGQKVRAGVTIMGILQ